MARRGYELTGFDANEKAVDYLHRRLAKRRLTADVFGGDLADFRLPQRIDAAFCTFNTFRHLTTERAALSHLQSVARSLKVGGIYILGFHLLPLDVSEECTERWSARRGKTNVSFTLRVLSTDRRRRLEQMRISMRVRTPRRELRLRNEFPLRMYTAAQFRRLLKRLPEFEMCDVFDFWYDICDPLLLDDELTDAVFVLRKADADSR
jgi:SAM-dependent methyltransferase